MPRKPAKAKASEHSLNFASLVKRSGRCTSEVPPPR